MPSLVVRNLDPSLIQALKERAVKHHRSMEAEHRAILAEILMKPQRKSLAEALAHIPDVGMDCDFERVNNESPEPHVFD